MAVNMKESILISGLGGSLFPYLHDRLAPKFKVFYVDSDETLKYLYPEYNFFHAPLVTSGEYPRFIHDLIEKNNINIYIPLIDEELKVAHEIKNDLDELILVSPRLDFVKLCNNKLDLMKELMKLNISSIQSETGSNIEAFKSYPIFVKPMYGRGSRGIKKINSTDHFASYLLLEDYDAEEVLVQELVEGQEYTVGVLTNQNNEILCLSSRKVITKKGITINAVNENNEFIEACVQKINSSLNPCGPYNVQLFIDRDNNVRVFEINPRFSTTTIMSYEGGLDLISIFLDQRLKRKNSNYLRPREGVYLRRNWRNNFYE